MNKNKLKAAVKKETDIVRRDHLNRLLAGPAAIEHLVVKDDSKQKAREKLAQEVGEIGRKNRLDAEKRGADARAKAAQKMAKTAAEAAKASADEALEKAKEAKKVDEVVALKNRVAELEAELGAA